MGTASYSHLREHLAEVWNEVGFAAAQAGGATPVVLVGTVVDETSHAPIQAANVRLLDDRGAQRATTTTDPNGQFRLAIPSPGSYIVRADRVGFRRGDGVPIAVGAQPPAPPVLALTRIPVTLDSMVTQAHPSIAGAWELDIHSVKGFETENPATFYFEQTATMLTRYLKGSNPVRDYFGLATFNLDGTPVIATTGGTEFRYLLRWDGPTLVLETKPLRYATTNSTANWGALAKLDTSTVSQRWTLSADGKTLKLRTEGQSARRALKVNAVEETFHKQ